MEGSKIVHMLGPRRELWRADRLLCMLFTKEEIVALKDWIHGLTKERTVEG